MTCTARSHAYHQVGTPGSGIDSGRREIRNGVCSAFGPENPEPGVVVVGGCVLYPYTGQDNATEAVSASVVPSHPSLHRPVRF